MGPAPKPLANRNFVIPTGACIYGSAVGTVNLEAATAAGDAPYHCEPVFRLLLIPNLFVLYLALMPMVLSTNVASLVLSFLTSRLLKPLQLASDTSVTVTTSKLLLSLLTSPPVDPVLLSLMQLLVSLPSLLKLITSCLLKVLIAMLSTCLILTVLKAPSDI